MRKHFNSVAVLSAVALICCGALILGQRVNAAGEGKITGTVKLDGAAPHMKAYGKKVAEWIAERAIHVLEAA